MRNDHDCDVKTDPHGLIASSPVSPGANWPRSSPNWSGSGSPSESRGWVNAGATITWAVWEIRPLPAAIGFAVPGKPDLRLHTLADVFAYAAADGVEMRIDGTGCQQPTQGQPARPGGFVSGKNRAANTTTASSASRLSRSEQEAERLRAENARLNARLAQTQAALVIMRKAHELLAALAENSDTPPASSP